MSIECRSDEYIVVLHMMLLGVFEIPMFLLVYQLLFKRPETKYLEWHELDAIACCLEKILVIGHVFSCEPYIIVVKVT
jgi:hypothetical protein